MKGKRKLASSVCKISGLQQNSDLGAQTEDVEVCVKKKHYKEPLDGWMGEISSDV